MHKNGTVKILVYFGAMKIWFFAYVCEWSSTLLQVSEDAFEMSSNINSTGPRGLRTLYFDGVGLSKNLVRRLGQILG